MYLSVRRSQHALLAIGFFVIMILTVFSTLLYEKFSLPTTSHIDLFLSSYFAERGTWDEVLGTFINSDGDPTQFSVCHKFFTLVYCHDVSFCFSFFF